MYIYIYVRIPCVPPVTYRRSPLLLCHIRILYRWTGLIIVSVCEEFLTLSLSVLYNPLVLYNNVERSLLVISSSYYTLITSNWIYFIDSGNIGNIRLDRENQIDRLTVRSITFEMEDTLEDLT